MTWEKTDADRKADAAFYSDPLYRRNKAIVKRRANGRCEDCGHRHDRLQCDHVIPRTKGGTHAIGNLRMLCSGDGTCRCHEKKTAQEGGGYRANRGNGNKTPRDPKPRPRTSW
jgi:5-methylcytosine-specific restriction endonuclease McrA